MMSKKMIKVISLILAGLMILSAVAVLLQVFAVDGSAAILAVTPKTGDNDLDYIVPIALIAAAVVAITVCLILPKLKKKDKE
ncbi:MAG: hypothetical protein NC122_06870 [Faecalibacterium sp.]|nr:hypothetical protein [Ruminococcus sp.]MCM1392215.1 hypothetical protein [Ruminococcus sp.]MCM1485912.1 hypothetical protein [Faecalibacterium sp.]